MQSQRVVTAANVLALNEHVRYCALSRDAQQFSLDCISIVHFIELDRVGVGIQLLVFGGGKRVGVNENVGGWVVTL